MDDLVETLAVGLFISLILIVISWWFWKRYDEPSEAQIEREESISKKEKETQMWHAVESQMVQERVALEEQALYERRKAEERARALPPPTGEVSNAFAAFDMERQTPVKSFTEHHDAPSAEAALIGNELEPEANDEDVLSVAELVEVRQDKAFVLEQQETVADLSSDAEEQESVLEPTSEATISETSDEIEASIPSAPDLDVLTQASSDSVSEPEWSLEREEPPVETDWSDNWFNNLEEE